MIQGNINVNGNSSNLQIPDITFVGIKNGNCVSSGNRCLTREKRSLSKVIQMHQQLQVSNEKNRKLTRKKTLVLQSYSNSRSFILASTMLGNKCKEKESFPPTHFLYTVVEVLVQRYTENSLKNVSC